MVFLSQELVIGCAISDPWAGKQCQRVVEKAGGRSIVVQPEFLDLPATLSRFSACIYDLAPWDGTVLARLHRLRDARPDMPMLFYLPPSPDAVAMAPDCCQFPNVRVSMQLHRSEDVRRLERDARWLIQSVPVQRMLDTLTGAFPGEPPVTRLFCKVVLRRLSGGMRCTVHEIGQDLGLSGRTVQRHLRASRLGTPKQVIDRLTVWYLLQLSELGDISFARAARTARMVPNDFYRLKKRVIESIGRSPFKRTWEEMIGEYRRSPTPSLLRPTRHLPRPVTIAVPRRMSTAI